MMKSSFKIAHLINGGTEIGGAERLLIDIANYSDHKIWGYCLITLDNPGILNDRLSQKGWPTFHLNIAKASQGLKGIFQLKKLIDRIKPDIIHTHLHKASFAGALVSTGGIPLLHTRHYSDFMVRYGNFLNRRIDYFVSHRSKGIAAVSEAVKEHLVKIERNMAEKVTVVPNGIDYKYLSSLNVNKGKELLRSLGVTSNLVIGNVASLHKRKGHSLLIEAFRVVHEKFPEAVLVIIGEGDERNSLQEKINAYSLGKSIILLGYREDAQILMSGFDIYAQPSIEEAFGIAVVEAMAMKKPVVVSAIGGLMDIIQDNVNGLTVESENPKALAERIIGLINNLDMRNLLAEQASLFVKNHFTIERTIEKYQEWYKTFLKEPNFAN